MQYNVRKNLSRSWMSMHIYQKLYFFKVHFLVETNKDVNIQVHFDVNAYIYIYQKLYFFKVHFLVETNKDVNIQVHFVFKKRKIVMICEKKENPQAVESCAIQTTRNQELKEMK
jgi:hypothetical protein